VAWLLPPLIAFATLGVSLLFPGVEYTPDISGYFERLEGVMPPEQIKMLKDQMSAVPIHPIWVALLSGLFSGITISAIAGFGEELGWRGFLQNEFSGLSFLKSSLIIGVIWGIWHAPLILQGHNYPQHPVIGVFMMIVWCVLFASIFSYVRIKSGSVIAAAIIHGTLNATAMLPLMVIGEGNDLTVGVTGLAGFIVLLAVNFCIFFFDRSFVRKPVSALLGVTK
jgi:membrane protease YdiL (CAAX protease family)